MHRLGALSAHLTAAHAPEDSPVVLYQVADRVALVTLHRPDRGNAYTHAMMEQYFTALQRANKDPDVVAIVVTGSGKMFCVGADKDMLAGTMKSTPPTTDVQQVQALELDKPVIGAIQGPAAGLGMVTAMMCDVRFGSPNTKFSTAFAKRGLIAEHGISWILPRVVGTSRAMDLLISSRIVKAAEAKEMGLLNFLCDSDETCLEEAIKYARQAGTLCSPAALSEIKRQIYEDAGTFRQDTNRANALMAKSFAHPDSNEGIRSFVENRAPSFPGLRAGKIRDAQV